MFKNRVGPSVKCYKMDIILIRLFLLSSWIWRILLWRKALDIGLPHVWNCLIHLHENIDNSTPKVNCSHAEAKCWYVVLSMENNGSGLVPLSVNHGGLLFCFHMARHIYNFVGVWFCEGLLYGLSYGAYLIITCCGWRRIAGLVLLPVQYGGPLFSHGSDIFTLLCALAMRRPKV